MSQFYIQPHIIARLQQGQFVANRSAHDALTPGLGPATQRTTGGERRQRLTPLALAKHAIRYEPLVFQHRINDLLAVAEALNQPCKRVVLIDGAPGSGKTAFVRALVELFGGGPEQLIWLKPNRLTDPLNLLKDLQHAVAHLTQQVAQVPDAQFEAAEAPGQITALSAQLRAHAQPVCIVIDPVSVWVHAQHQIAEALLRLLLEALLACPNVKLVLVGDRLPTADFATTHNAVMTLTVKPLNWEQFSALLPLLSPSKVAVPPLQSRPEALSAGDATDVWPPWLATWISRLNTVASLSQAQPQAQRFTETLAALMRLPQPTPKQFLDSLWPIWDAWLHQEAHGNGAQDPQDAHRKPECAFWLWLFLLARHPLDAQALTGFTESHAEQGAEAIQAQLLSPASALSAILQRSFQPQTLLSQLVPPQPSAQTLYAEFEPFSGIRQLLGPLTAKHLGHPAKAHLALMRFYVSERQKPRRQRWRMTSQQLLLTEARYHSAKTHGGKIIEPDPFHPDTTTSLAGGQSTPKEAAPQVLPPLLPDDWHPDWLAALTTPNAAFALKPPVPERSDQTQGGNAKTSLNAALSVGSGIEAGSVINSASSSTQNFSSNSPSQALEQAMNAHASQGHWGEWLEGVEPLVEHYLAQGQWRSAAYLLAQAANKALLLNVPHTALEWYWQQGNVLLGEGGSPKDALRAYQNAFALTQVAHAGEDVEARLRERITALKQLP
ncbi:MAG: ATP-binding protein [Vampirovibrionales bacterium]|nr:ATP-binding protein [Vampirovibrionales bacterium]